MLEDVLPPKKLYWLAHAEMQSVDPSHWVDVATFIGDCLCCNRAKNAQYLCEVMRVYSWIRCCIDKVDLFVTSKFNFNDSVLRANSTPRCDPATLSRLVAEISTHTGNTNNAQRLLLSHLQTQMAATCPHMPTESDPDDDGTNADRFIRLVSNYSAECSFKTHGDFLVHAILIVTKLPPWASSMLCENDMPYPLMKQTYPDTVNQEVRPLLDASMDERIVLVQWTAPEFVPEDYILIVSLLLEIIASPSVVLLVNGTLMHGMECNEPMPYIVRNDDATVSTGYRYQGVFYCDESTLDTVSRVTRWLWFTHTVGSKLTHDTCEIVMNQLPVSARNPLKKYAS